MVVFICTSLFSVIYLCKNLINKTVTADNCDCDCDCNCNCDRDRDCDAV